MLLVVRFDNEGGENVCTRNSYFTVTRPVSVSVEGLFDIVGKALQSLWVSAISKEDCSRLVGLCNIAHSGLRVLWRTNLLGYFGCGVFAHRLSKMP